MTMSELDEAMEADVKKALLASLIAANRIRCVSGAGCDNRLTNADCMRGKGDGGCICCAEGADASEALSKWIRYAAA